MRWEDGVLRDHMGSSECSLLREQPARIGRSTSATMPIRILIIAFGGSERTNYGVRSTLHGNVATIEFYTFVIGAPWNNATSDYSVDLNYSQIVWVS